jgi:O-antigen ligase
MPCANPSSPKPRKRPGRGPDPFFGRVHLNAILIVLVVALVAKDTSYLGDPYLLRGFAQGLCLLAGGAWVARHFTPALLARYWPLWGYLAALAVSTPGTADPLYVGLQVLSLAAVVLFFVAYFETRRRQRAADPARTLLDATLLCYTVVVILSLVVSVLAPRIAYETLYGGEVRFRGLFSKSAMIGSAAGLVVGIAWLRLTAWRHKAVPLVAGFACLALTQSRTFWIAALVAGVLTSWVYRCGSRKWALAGLAAGVLAVLASAAFDLSYEAPGVGKIVRADSIANLTGRLTLWETGMRAFEKRPLLGFGFTAGSQGVDALDSGPVTGYRTPSASRDIGRTTLHSGFLQSLLDSGITGTLFYAAAMWVALLRLLGRDAGHRHAAEFYALVYLLVANATQNVIYSASVYDSIFFWALAVFALGMPRADAAPARLPGGAHVRAR